MISRMRKREREREREITGKQAGGFTLFIIKVHKQKKKKKKDTCLKFLWVILEENISVLLDTS